LLAYTQIPSVQLIKPEETAVPKYTYAEKDGSVEKVPLTMTAMSKLSEARERAIRETEVLHLPLPGSGGRTYAPLMVFENPFPQLGKADKDKTSKRALTQKPEGFLKHYE
jgi:hypothetical protein